MSSRLVNKKGVCTGVRNIRSCWVEEKGMCGDDEGDKSDTAAMPCDLGRESGREVEDLCYADSMLGTSIKVE